jgi:hypothetical protein
MRSAPLLTLLCLSLQLVASAADAVPRRAFVTSVSGPGNLGTWPDAGIAVGLAAGIAICTARASAAGLSGTFRPWLSTIATDAYCLVRGQAGHKANGCEGGFGAVTGPWYQMGAFAPAFSPGLADLTGPERVIFQPVRYDEFGNQLPANELDFTSRAYWTGTRSDGTLESGTANCGNWTVSTGYGVVGDGLATAEYWTAVGPSSCAEPRRLLCLEQGSSDPVDPMWLPGALAFVTSAEGPADLASWPEAAGAPEGIAAGDAICRRLANNAGLPGSFVAWLSDADVDARDRVVIPSTLRRVDGRVLVNDWNELTTAGILRSSLHVDERGRYLVDDGGAVHTGTFADGTGGNGAYSCDDWTASGSQNTILGWASYARLGGWTANAIVDCGPTRLRHLYCFSNLVTLFWDGFEYTGNTARWSADQP